MHDEPEPDIAFSREIAHGVYPGISEHNLVSLKCQLQKVQDYFYYCKVICLTIILTRSQFSLESYIEY